MPKPSRPAVQTKRPSRGRADLARLRNTTDAEIARTSPPELTDIPESLWQQARVVTPVEKQAISIRLDRDILDFFRAAGPRYQSKINAVLRSYMEHATAPAQPRRRRSG
jgi:uncharacterized protein (DUF4415 family)